MRKFSKSGLPVLAAVLLVACASSPDKADNSKMSESVGAETPDISSAQYSDDEIMGLMFGTGSRDKTLFSARLAEAEKHPLGSENNPIRVHMPEGQRAYLSRLKCVDGKTPKFNRVGSMGPGPYETIVDLYDVTCKESLPEKSEIYMDMYFPGYVENDPVKGFTID